MPKKNICPSCHPACACREKKMMKLFNKLAICAYNALDIMEHDGLVEYHAKLNKIEKKIKAFKKLGKQPT